MTTTKPSLSGTVYFIGSMDGHVKIGHTRGAVKARLSALQTASPSRLTLLASTPGTFRLERQLHALFADQRTVGEWFKRNEQLDAIIEMASRGDERLIATPRPGPKPRTVQPNPDSWTQKIMTIMQDNPDHEFGAQELHRILGSGGWGEIPSALQGLCKRGQITRVALGRYVYGERPHSD